jgi:hypothetical protein
MVALKRVLSGARYARGALFRLALQRVSKDDVFWAYRTILRRTPESDEVIDEHHRTSDLRKLVEVILRSSEYATIAGTMRSQIELPAATYVALGTHCFSSSFLRRLGVREWSGPFDWTFSSLPMVAHCIADDFKTFLDRSQYEPVPVDQRPNGPTVNRVQHRFYLTTFGVQYVFNHHDVHLDEGYEYLVRCVERFRAALQSPQHKVFLATCWMSTEVLAQLRQVCDALRARTQTFRMVAFAIEPDTNDVLPAVQPLADERHLVAWSYRPASPWGAVAFADAIDETCMARTFARSVTSSPSA